MRIYLKEGDEVEVVCEARYNPRKPTGEKLMYLRPSENQDFYRFYDGEKWRRIYHEWDDHLKLGFLYYDSEEVDD